MIKAEQVPQVVKDAFYNAYWREEAAENVAMRFDNEQIADYIRALKSGT